MTATTGEARRLRFGLTTIRYGLRRSARRATVSIAVDPEEGVIVTAPATAPLEKIEAVLRRKGAWILGHLRRQEELRPRPAPRELVSGETFCYLGRQHRLRVQPGARSAAALLAGRLCVTAPGPRERRAALVAWYRARAAERLPERVAQWAQRLRLPPPPVLIREQRRRWGSCDPGGTLRLNWRVVQLPWRLIDYVIAHELVHLQHKDHTAAFWAALGRALPDCDARRDELRRRGAEVEW